MKNLLFCLLCLSSMCALAQEKQILIYLQNESPVAFDIEKIDSICFSAKRDTFVKDTTFTEMEDSAAVSEFVITDLTGDAKGTLYLNKSSVQENLVVKITTTADSTISMSCSTVIQNFIPVSFNFKDKTLTWNEDENRFDFNFEDSVTYFQESASSTVTGYITKDGSITVDFPVNKYELSYSGEMVK